MSLESGMHSTGVPDLCTDRRHSPLKVSGQIFNSFFFGFLGSHIIYHYVILGVHNMQLVCEIIKDPGKKLLKI